MAEHANPAMARVGKYLMLDLLGEGAFGKVRLAVDETTGAEYAIKIMQKSHIKANELTLQVRREIAVMKAMTHPNIVNLHEVLTSSNNLYMVMDLVTGGELFHAVADEGRIPEHLTRSYFHQLVDAVDYCHSRRVYHRDLKPENLLLSADKHTLKITDFGLSSIKAQNASSELLHTIMGSPHYIAPEIITSAASGYDGAKVDVWASGVILFGMLAGYLPFDEPNTRALYKAIVQDPVKYPPHFSYDVIKLLRAMLQKHPDKRPTMDQVKTFAWFKVNYQTPLPEEDNKPPEKPDRKKLRHKLRKHADKAVKKKKDKDDDSHARHDPFKHARRKRDTSDADAVDDAKFGARSSVVVEICTTNLGDETVGAGPAAAPGASSRTSQDSHRQTKENVDPARSFSDRSDPSRAGGKGSDGVRFFSRTSNTGKPFGKSSDTSRSRSGDATQATRPGDAKSGLKGLDPGRSFTKLSNAARSLAKSRMRNSSSGSQQLAREVSQASLGKNNSGAHSDKLGAKASRSASFSSQPSVVQFETIPDSYGQHMAPISTEARDAGSASGTLSDKDSVQRGSSSQRSSDADSGPSRKSTMGSDTVASLMSISGDKGKTPARLSVNADSGEALIANKASSSSSDFEPASLTAFVSPVSENSRASFLTPGYKKKRPGSLKGHYSVPTAFESPISHSFDDGMTPVNSMVNSAIFKPMSVKLEALALQTPKTNKESMSPSVFCPEVEDDDVEGPTEWGIDSVEVFADVELPEKKGMPQIQVPKPTGEPSIAEQVQSPNGLKRMESSSFSIIDEAKPIFGPLSSELVFKLTPSMEAEAAGTAAVRRLPTAHTKG